MSKRLGKQTTVARITTKSSMERRKENEAYLALMCNWRVWRDDDSWAPTAATWVRVPALGSKQARALDSMTTIAHSGQKNNNKKNITPRPRIYS